MQVGEGVSMAMPGKCSEDCPFCETNDLLGFHTKHGAIKEERVLAANLAADGDVTSDRKVGNVYPTPGGGDKTTGWKAKAGVLEDFEVCLAAAPHHLVPGKASMEPSRVEKWTLESKGKILEDVGYNIDGAPNGVFLPHLPEIYWTRRIHGEPMSKYYGQTWSGLSPSAKQSIGFLVMSEVCRQMHYTDHDDPYVHVDNETTYDDEAKAECNHAADFYQQKESVSGCKDNEGKLKPPYAVISMLNGKSRKMNRQISGLPGRWSSWVSPLAQDLTSELKRLNLRGFPQKLLFEKLTN